MTRVIILAAGEGKRLRPITNDLPKCMIKLGGIPLITRQLELLRELGIKNINIVTGYKSEFFESMGCNLINNKNYKTTNMLYSLMLAYKLFDSKEDILVLYSDIIFEKKIIKQIININKNIVVAADDSWEKLWSKRMDDYINDVESFKLGDKGQIIEIGKKVNSIQEIKAQYMGIIKFSKNIQSQIISLYKSIIKDDSKRRSEINSIYLTEFLQILIDRNFDIFPSITSGGWLEIDTLEDLEIYENLYEDNILGELCNLEIYSEPFDLLRAYKNKLGNQTFNAKTNKFFLKDFINDCFKNIPINNLEKTGFKIARKIEILNILYSSYEENSLKTIEGRINANPKEIFLVLIAFIYLFDLTKDFRHLNTVLKGLDSNLIRELKENEIKKIVKMVDIRLK